MSGGIRGKYYMKDNTYTITFECANCAVIMKPVFPDMPNSNPELALELRLSGGYGMYYDAIDLTTYLCFACATNLLAKFPGLNRRFQKHLVRYDSKGVEDSESAET